MESERFQQYQQQQQNFNNATVPWRASSSPQKVSFPKFFPYSNCLFSRLFSQTARTYKSFLQSPYQHIAAPPQQQQFVMPAPAAVILKAKIEQRSITNCRFLNNTLQARLIERRRQQHRQRITSIRPPWNNSRLNDRRSR